MINVAWTAKMTKRRRVNLGSTYRQQACLGGYTYSDPIDSAANAPRPHLVPMADP